MNARARQAFLAAYERRMLTLFTREPPGRRVSYRVGLGLQARALAAALPDVDGVCRAGEVEMRIRWFTGQVQ
jgi:hypothetical protein